MSVIGGLVAHPIYRWHLSRKIKTEMLTPNSDKVIERREYGVFDVRSGDVSPRPHVEYAIFATFKAAELMSVIGGLVAHPIYRWHLSRKIKTEMLTPNSDKVIRTACRKLQGRFLIAGLVAAPFLSRLETHFSGTTDSELKNRCYAIRCNAETLSLDRAVLVCGFIGWYWKRFQGAVDGINVGIAYAMVNSQFIAPRTSPVLKNSIEESERFESVEAMEESKSKLNKFLAEQDRKDAAAPTSPAT